MSVTAIVLTTLFVMAFVIWIGANLATTEKRLLYRPRRLYTSGDADFRRETQHLEVLVAAIALEEGFQVNHHKTRVMRQSQRQHLLGLVTNQQPNVPRRTRERLEAILTNAARHGLASQNRDANPHFLESLRGQVAWVAQANPDHARKFRQLLEACERR